MSAVAVAGAVAVACIIFAVVLVLLRHRAYRRRIFYDPRQSCILGMAGPAVETRSVPCSGEGFVLPEPLMGVSVDSSKWRSALPPREAFRSGGRDQGR